MHGAYVPPGFTLFFEVELHKGHMINMALKNQHILTLFLLYWHHYFCFTYCIPFHLRMAFFLVFFV